MKNADLIPLAPGDLALRVRTRHRLGSVAVEATGLEVVEVVAVAGEVVTWTNHKKNPRWGGARFVHASNRRELIALAALENLSPSVAEKSAVPAMAGAAGG